MRARRGWVGGAAAALLACAAKALAQAVRPESLRTFGGTYPTEGKNPAVPGMRICRRAGDRTWATAQAPLWGHGFFHQLWHRADVADPAGLRNGVPRRRVSIYVFQEKAGYYMEPSVYVPAAESVMGKALMKTRFRRCAVPAP